MKKAYGIVETVAAGVFLSVTSSSLMLLLGNIGMSGHIKQKLQNRLESENTLLIEVAIKNLYPDIEGPVLLASSKYQERKDKELMNIKYEDREYCVFSPEK